MPFLAAAFFVTYEALKTQLPQFSTFLADSQGTNHMIAASGAEFVRALSQSKCIFLFY